MDARFAVTVVPIFSPNIIAAASSKGIHPWAVIRIVKANVALDDWMIIVMRVPISRNNRMDP